MLGCMAHAGVFCFGDAGNYLDYGRWNRLFHFCTVYLFQPQYMDPCIHSDAGPDSNRAYFGIVLPVSMRPK
jgi:hypothetical protein